MKYGCEAGAGFRNTDGINPCFIRVSSVAIHLAPPCTQEGARPGVRGDSVPRVTSIHPSDTKPPHPGPLPLSTGGEGAYRQQSRKWPINIRILIWFLLALACGCGPGTRAVLHNVVLPEQRHIDYREPPD